MQRCTWKTKFLGTSSEELFRTLSDRISHCIHTVRTFCSQLSARSGIFCLLIKIVYWPCGLKFVYPTINLAFWGIIVKVKNPANFCLYSFVYIYKQGFQRISLFIFDIVTTLMFSVFTHTHPHTHTHIYIYIYIVGAVSM